MQSRRRCVRAKPLFPAFTQFDQLLFTAPAHVGGDGFGSGDGTARRFNSASWDVWFLDKRNRPGAILVARPRVIDGPDGMGAKYLPTIKDLKASQRFQQKLNRLPKFKKASSDQASKKGKRK